MEKMIVIVNDKTKSKGFNASDFLFKLIKKDAVVRTIGSDDNIDSITLSEFKKNLLKCKSLNDECKLFDDVFCLVLINIPSRYKNFIEELYTDENANDKFFQFYGYNRRMYLYDTKDKNITEVEF